MPTSAVFGVQPIVRSNDDVTIAQLCHVIEWTHVSSSDGALFTELTVKDDDPRGTTAAPELLVDDA